MAVDGEQLKDEQQQEKEEAAGDGSSEPKPLDERTLVFGLYKLLRSVDISVSQ